MEVTKNIEGNYICKIEILEELIQSSIFLDNKLKYQGIINLQKVQAQIKTFLDYSIEEIFDEIKLLNQNSFAIIKKENNKYQLKIEFEILRKKKYIIIDLNEKELNDEQINSIINKYKKIIKEKDDYITKLKEEIAHLKTQLEIKENEEKDKNNIFEKDFNITSKEPIKILNDCHSKSIICLSNLNDGRLVSGSIDKKIIIYNKETYQPELTIESHQNYVVSIIQLSSGFLASCSYDYTVKIFDINGNNYKEIQTLKHALEVTKIIELKNKYLVSCSLDKTINFYKNCSNNEYTKDFSTKADGPIYYVIQTKENEICYSERFEYNNFNICFFNLEVRKNINKITNISCDRSLNPFNMISKDLLVIGGRDIISIVNVNQYKLIGSITVNGSIISGFCMINENMFLTGDKSGSLSQWKKEGDKITLVSKKEKAHSDRICSIIMLDDGHLVSSSKDAVIKVW